MVLPSDDIYRVIGQSIVDNVAGGWNLVLINVNIMADDVLSVTGTCVNKDGTKKIFTPPNVTLKALYQIYHSMSESPKGQWKTMSYELKPDGRFEISFTY